MRIHRATNTAFGTTFAGDTPIAILADYVEEHDDGSPEFAELVKFLRG
jgi:hypothetical protein